MHKLLWLNVCAPVVGESMCSVVVCVHAVFMLGKDQGQHDETALGC